MSTIVSIQEFQSGVVGRVGAIRGVETWVMSGIISVEPTV